MTLPDVGLFSDGTAVKLVGEETFRVARELVDEFITVDTDAVCAAIKDVFIDTRSIVEPAGALAVAAIKQYVRRTRHARRDLRAILCGANMNFDRLRFVAERAEVGEEREALFAVTIPEERGSFRRFCELVGSCRAARATSPSSTTASAMRRRPMCSSASPRTARGESKTIADTFTRHGFDALDLTHDELAKEHIRHMVGGRTGLAHDERLLRFVFPERPGRAAEVPARSCGPNWNISLFHYRNQGADYGRILVGPAGARRPTTPPSTTFCETLGYPCVEETANPVYRLFLQA